MKNTNKIWKYLPVLIGVIMVVLSFRTAFADSSVTCGTDSQICNPISGASNIQDVIVMVVKYLMGLIGILSVLMIMVGAYQLTFTGANPKSAEQGKNTITYAIAGLVLSILAYSVVAILEALIKSGS